MPLYLKNNNYTDKTALQYQLRDIEVSFCSETCLLRNMPDDAIYVRNGQTPGTWLAVLLESTSQLIIPIQGVNRTEKHVLGPQEYKNAHERWSKLVGHKCSNIMSINKICHCMALVTLQEGIPLVDANTTPPWQRWRVKEPDIFSKNKGIDYNTWSLWMAGLASGLAFLHSKGLAHGDPFPYNALILDKHSVWVDLGNLGEGILQIETDIWCFTIFTLLYTFSFCAEWSESCLDEIIKILAENDPNQMAAAMQQALSKQRTDIIPSLNGIDFFNCLREVWEKYEPLMRKDSFGSTGRKMFLRGLSLYYADMLNWIKNSKYLTDLIECERARHFMVESELRRLMVPKEEVNILRNERDKLLISEAMLKQTNFEQKNAYEKQINELKQRISELDKLLISEAMYKEKVTEYERQINECIQLAEKVSSDLSQLYISRSYKILRLFRLLKDELLSCSYSRIIAVLKKFFVYLMGKRNVLADYWKSDIIYHNLQLIQDNIIKLRKEKNQSLPHLPEIENIVRENRRITYQKNRTKGNKVAYFTNQLLDWHDQRPRYGGGERYCLNIAQLLRENGFEVDLYQLAPNKFQGEYHGFSVQAIPHGEFYSEFNIGASNKFYDISLNYDHVIYNMPELSATRMRPDAIMICHGIWFDHDNYPAAKFRQKEWFRYLYNAFKNPETIVSVDTNSINVIRSLWPELATKMTYIPNFVDHRLFYPKDDKDSANDLLTIIFPRRSQINRGSRILGEILKRVHSKNVEIFWIGEGDEQDTKLIKDLCIFDSRLRYVSASFEEMPDWYRKADICVIPTIACEGTSLSCIEALASGCAVIATNVGGLPDIIHDGINGRLVDPTPQAIATAINELIENEEERKRLQQNGVNSSRAFSIERWKAAWLEILKRNNWIKNPVKSTGIPMDSEKDCKEKAFKTVIVTRNAYHGGVETLIKLESYGIKAPVIVAGGLNDPAKTCPFTYTYVSTYEELRDQLQHFDVILYHWPLDWAVEAIKDSGLPSIEFVHRIDTSECDKSVPTLVVTHSEYVAEYLKDNFNADVRIVPNCVDDEHFKPGEPIEKNVIGAITSYYETKGIDIFLEAWAEIAEKYPNIIVRFYGAGDQLENLKRKARQLGLNVDFRGPLSDPAPVYREYKLYITAARVEGLPLAVLEALASNVRVVASDIPGHSVINEIARNNGMPEPLILFASENVNDLVEKIEYALNLEEEPNVREVVQAVFSPKKHVTELRKVIKEAYEIGSKHPKVELMCLEEIENTGELSENEFSEGFFFISQSSNNDWTVEDKRNSVSSEIISTYDRFICYRYYPNSSADRISCLIICDFENSADVFVQFDWYDRQNNLLKMVGSGRRVDHANNRMYIMQQVPQELKEHFHYVRVNIRPNPGQLVKIRKIKIASWKEIC
ncbi:MAG: glycosyltransferase [Peptococcaceae bacterium MAG4]|jgi:glycosyltransferase involved in cell wall biosynthesis/ribosomal protein L24|nr:glycosyltransferase [Peptococcaceae bacterium MAG4]NLW39120.1 glycosyltransferase [Peptococcaceae bacterium]